MDDSYGGVGIILGYITLGVDGRFITLGVNFDALDRNCYDRYQTSYSDKIFYCVVPDTISLLDIVSWYVCLPSPLPPSPFPVPG